MLSKIQSDPSPLGYGRFFKWSEKIHNLSLCSKLIEHCHFIQNITPVSTMDELYRKFSQTLLTLGYKTHLLIYWTRQSVSPSVRQSVGPSVCQSLEFAILLWTVTRFWACLLLFKWIPLNGAFPKDCSFKQKFKICKIKFALKLLNCLWNINIIILCIKKI